MAQQTIQELRTACQQLTQLADHVRTLAANLDRIVRSMESGTQVGWAPTVSAAVPGFHGPLSGDAAGTPSAPSRPVDAVEPSPYGARYLQEPQGVSSTSSGPVHAASPTSASTGAIAGTPGPSTASPAPAPTWRQSEHLPYGRRL
jgi:hypothetical protein